MLWSTQLDPRISKDFQPILASENSNSGRCVKSRELPRGSGEVQRALRNFGVDPEFLIERFLDENMGCSNVRGRVLVRVPVPLLMLVLALVLEAVPVPVLFRPHIIANFYFPIFSIFLWRGFEPRTLLFLCFKIQIVVNM